MLRQARAPSITLSLAGVAYRRAAETKDISVSRSELSALDVYRHEVNEPEASYGFEPVSTTRRHSVTGDGVPPITFGM